MTVWNDIVSQGRKFRAKSDRIYCCNYRAEQYWMKNGITRTINGEL